MPRCPSMPVPGSRCWTAKQDSLQSPGQVCSRADVPRDRGGFRLAQLFINGGLKPILHTMQSTLQARELLYARAGGAPAAATAATAAGLRGSGRVSQVQQ